MNPDLDELRTRLSLLLDSDPSKAIAVARSIDEGESEFEERSILKGAILIDAGCAANDMTAVMEGVAVTRGLHALAPSSITAFNLANGLAAIGSRTLETSEWLDQRVSTESFRAESRSLLWEVLQSDDEDSDLATQAYSNLANQYAASCRLYEAHDARLDALSLDPTNGVAAGEAAIGLQSLYDQGGSSEITLNDAALLAKQALLNLDSIRRLAGKRAIERFQQLANRYEDISVQTMSTDQFILWVQRERLALAPAVTLIEPDRTKIDWLMIDRVIDQGTETKAQVPQIFSMFNLLKADFILARDLLWKSMNHDDWPDTGRYTDTLDYAAYGPDAAALAMAYKMAVDLLDKVAVATNSYYALGCEAKRVRFDLLFREKDSGSKLGVLRSSVSNVVRHGVRAMYGLAELSDDYRKSIGNMRESSDLRHAGTHRFIQLHCMGYVNDSILKSEVVHLDLGEFRQQTIRQLRVARSAIQLLSLSVRQHTQSIESSSDNHFGLHFLPDQI